jgi:hypothetical protein
MGHSSLSAEYMAGLAGLGDWVDYSVVFAVKAMWDAVVGAFAASTLAVVHESLESLSFPEDLHATLQTRIPEVVDVLQPGRRRSG